jgi:hypothetical protein
VHAAEQGGFILRATLPSRLLRRLPEIAEIRVHTAVMLDETSVGDSADARMLGLAIEQLEVEPRPGLASGLRRILVRLRTRRQRFPARSW